MLEFTRKKTAEKTGKIIGYVISYFVFTTIFYLILSFTGRLSSSFTYLHIAGITLAITLFGVLIKQLLK